MKMFSKTCIIRMMLAGLMITAGTIPSAWSAPITSNTALPVAKGEYIFRQQIILNKSSDDPSSADRTRVSKRLVSVLGYGATREIAVFGVLPYLDTQLELTEGGTRKVRSVRGIGDFTLFARYAAYTQNKRGQTFRIAPFVGLKMPTGKDNKNDLFGRLPISVQLGSGSWDPFVGVILTYQTLDYQVDGELSYKANTKANGFEFGDVASLKGSLQVRLWPQELSSDLSGFLYGVTEANLVYKAQNQDNNVSDINSGGTSLFFTPGLQYITKRQIIETSIQIPLVQDLNGTALQNDFVARAGFRINF